MSDWFTVDKIDQETYIISEYKHWEETHCYLLNGADESLLIDSGMGIQNIHEEVKKLTSNPVTVVATHTHWDHIGGHGLFSKFYVHEYEAEWLDGHFPLTLEYIKSLVIEEPCAFPAGFKLDDYKVFQGKPSKILHDGDTIDLGGRTVQVLHTPGHAPGHMCFYDGERNHLFSGDLVYKGKLTAFFPTTDPLAYKKSMEKIAALKTDKLFPAHHELDISPALVAHITAAFNQLDKQGKLKHGSGVFSYQDFQIEL